MSEVAEPDTVGRIRAVVAEIGRPLRIMEVCGTHTVCLRRHGIHSLLPPSLSLVSGPGCPVCVTPATYVDNALRLIAGEGALVAAFGDMLRVPASTGATLALHLGTRAVRVVYSPTDLPALAASEPGRPVVFLGVGFETTAPTVASVFARVHEDGPRNLFLYSALKTIPPALEALTRDESLAIDGFLLPGHVSVVIGARAYGCLTAGTRSLPGVIAGFEPEEMLRAILALVELIRDRRSEVLNAYARAVRPEGNPHALAAMAEVFEPATEPWRGMGSLPGAALAVRADLASIDAARRFGLATTEAADPPGCRCADVLRGALPPAACTLYGRACTPDRPIGPCMVSSEGTCSASFRYERDSA